MTTAKKDSPDTIEKVAQNVQLFDQAKVKDISPIRTSQEDSASPMQPISTASLPGKSQDMAATGIDYTKHDLLAGAKRTSISFEESMIA